MSFVVDVLTGKTYLEPSRDDRTALDTLLNVWRRGQRNDELHAGFVEALTHSNPTVRAGAVMFFARMTTSTDDLDPLHAALTEETALYDGVREPWLGGAKDLWR